MERPKAIDLFSGAGGLTQGLKQAGFNVIGAVEIDRVFADSYSMNHPRTRLINSDICNLSLDDAAREWKITAGELDLLAGCPPCQGFSKIGTRNKGARLEDKRNDLVFQVIRFSDYFQPKVIMIENVPALAKDDRMKKITNHLKEKGYNIDIRILNTENYEVPQRRNRMILLASRLGQLEVQTEFENITVAKTVGDVLPKIEQKHSSNDPLWNYKVNRTEKINKMISLIPKNGGSRVDLPPEYELECHKKTKGFKDVYGRMSWDKPSPTITCGCISPSKGRFLHPEENRAINLREAASLQTFPYNYRFSFKKGRQGVATMIGNALPPKFIEYQGRVIKSHLHKHEFLETHKEKSYRE